MEELGINTRRNAVLTKIDTVMLMLDKLTDDIFDFSQYIAETNIELVVENSGDPSDLCGTVCCVVGWMPKYIPEAGFKWDLSKNNVLNIAVTNPTEVIDKFDIESQFSKYIGLTTDVTNTLIYGSPDTKTATLYKLYNTENEEYESVTINTIHNFSTLAVVKEQYSYIRGLVENGTLDYFIL